MIIYKRKLKGEQLQNVESCFCIYYQFLKEIEIVLV